MASSAHVDMQEKCPKVNRCSNIYIHAGGDQTQVLYLDRIDKINLQAQRLHGKDRTLVSHVSMHLRALM